MAQQQHDSGTNAITVFRALLFTAVLCAQMPHGHACECELTDYKNCSRTIDIAVLMQNSTARQALPVIYLAKKDLEEQGMRGPLQNWSISITYKDTKGCNVDATLETFRLHDDVTKKCQPKPRLCQPAKEQSKTATVLRQAGEDTNSERDCGQEERSQLDVILGPVERYSLADVARAATSWKIPVLSPSSAGEDFKKTYKYLYNMNGLYSQLAKSIRKLLTEWQWNHVHILFESYGANSVNGRTTCSFAMDSINQELRNYNFTVNETMVYNNGSYSATEKFEKMAGKARVILACFENLTMLEETLNAAKSPPYSNKEDYIILFIDITGDAAASPNSPSKGHTRWLEASSVLAERFKPMFVITTRAPNTGPQQHLASRIGRLLSEKSQEELRRHLNTMGGNESSLTMNHLCPLVASFYDAVWYFFQAFNRTLDKKKKNYNEIADFTTVLFDEMNNGTFRSHLRNATYTVENRIIPVQYSLLNWRRVNNEASFKEVAYIDGAYNSSDQWISSNEAIYWYNQNYSWEGWNSSRPNDNPTCGFKDECENDERRTLTIIMGVLAAFAIILLIVIAALVRKYVRERNIDRKLWKIPYSDIEIIKDSVQRNEKTFPPNKGSQLQLLAGSYYGGSSKSVLLGNLKSEGTAKLGKYKGQQVVIKELPEHHVDLTKELLVELTEMKELENRNVANFFGACVEAPNYYLVMEYCPKGSLLDILKDISMRLDDLMKYSLLHDLIQGLSKLHSSKIKFHGNLKSSNCVVNSQFVLKVTDFGLLCLRNPETSRDWSAPERLATPLLEMTTEKIKQGDIYSLGIIMLEVLTRKNSPLLKNATLIQRKESGQLEPRLANDQDLQNLITDCKAHDPEQRPQLSTVKNTIQRFYQKYESGNIMDNILKRMEQHSNDLEREVEKRTKIYLEEKKNCEVLLYQLLPESVTKELVLSGRSEAKSFDSVTICLSDIVGFTAISAESSPMQIVEMLNCLFINFDSCVEGFDVYKVETIGDAYMVVSGLPNSDNVEHAKEIAGLTLALLDEVEKFRIPHMPEMQLKVRLGVHSGPCVAGVVGKKMPRYCLFGDTVNTAYRMESSGEPMKVHISSCTHDLLQCYPQFMLERRSQQLELKGKGFMTTYWLKGREPAASVEQPMGEMFPQGSTQSHTQDSLTPRESLSFNNCAHFDCDVEIGSKNKNHRDHTEDKWNAIANLRNWFRRKSSIFNASSSNNNVMSIDNSSYPLLPLK